MSLVPHVNNICKTSCLHLRAIRKIRQFLDKDSTILLLHAFVISRLDYCNSLLFGLPDYVINRLQLIQNSAARLVFCVRKHDHVTPLLINLHWLPIKYRIQFKILLMTFKVLCGEAPSYQCDLITPYVPTCTLRSQRAFKTSAPCLWNDLPYNIKSSKDINEFKKKLKTHLFKKFFALEYDICYIFEDLKLGRIFISFTNYFI